jgi:hypothetical protein
MMLYLSHNTHTKHKNAGSSMKGSAGLLTSSRRIHKISVAYDSATVTLLNVYTSEILSWNSVKASPALHYNKLHRFVCDSLTGLSDLING